MSSSPRCPKRSMRALGGRCPSRNRQAGRGSGAVAEATNRRGREYPVRRTCLALMTSLQSLPSVAELFEQQETPRTLRPLRRVRIRGNCAFDISQFHLKQAKLGATKIARLV